MFQLGNTLKNSSVQKFNETHSVRSKKENNIRKCSNFVGYGLSDEHTKLYLYKGAGVLGATNSVLYRI